MNNYRKVANYLLGFVLIFFYFGGISMVFAADYYEGFYRFRDNPISISTFYIVGAIGTTFGIYLIKNKPFPR